MTSVSGNGWTMHLGDCLDVLSTLARVDHVITDPPYELEAHTRQRRVKRHAGVVAEPLDFAPITEEVRERFAVEAGRVCARWLLVFCQVEASHKWRAALEAGQLAYRRTGVWVKPDGQPQLSGDRPGMGYESIVIMHSRGRSRWNGGGRSSVFVHNKNDPTTSNKKNDHPTTKPRPLILELVELFTDAGETVLDPFAGSGTTGIAAIRRGRRFVGVEKDPKYFDLACERLRAEDSGSTLRDARAGQLPLLAVST